MPELKVKLCTLTEAANLIPDGARVAIGGIQVVLGSGDVDTFDDVVMIVVKQGSVHDTGVIGQAVLGPEIVSPQPLLT